MRARGQKPVLVVPGAIRRAVARVIAGSLPVIALEEIPETLNLTVVQTAGAEAVTDSMTGSGPGEAGVSKAGVSEAVAHG
jgi:hypothetical protein